MDVEAANDPAEDDAGLRLVVGDVASELDKGREVDPVRVSVFALQDLEAKYSLVEIESTDARNELRDM